MAIGTAILLGVGLYLLAALPVAVVIGRMLGGPSTDASARPSGASALTLPLRAPLTGSFVGAHVAASRPVALVAGHPHAAGNLQLARAEAHPAHA